jgi:hypothetical protein
MSGSDGDIREVPFGLEVVGLLEMKKRAGKRLTILRSLEIVNQLWAP